MEHTTNILNCPACAVLLEEEHGFIETNPDFWDCECPEGYFKLKASEPTCDKCDSSHEDLADSRVIELKHFGYI